MKQNIVNHCGAIAASAACAAWAALLSVGLIASVSHAQSGSASQISVSTTAADNHAARAAKSVHRHGRLANTAAAAEAKGTTATINGKSNESNKNQVRFPGDLSYQGGAVVTSALSHAIYMNRNGTCTIASCWGDPEGFLRDLAQSDLIHVVDQYVGATASGRYSVGASAMINYVTLGRFDDFDILTQVHAVAQASGQAGVGHIYHVFLPPGQSVCSANVGCYSPDDPFNFSICGYHGSADFADIGHVLYTVEPYQNVSGCQVVSGSVNGALIDSTNNTLSHELIETITNPNGDAWYNNSLIALFQSEIGDECSFFNLSGFFDPPTFRVGRKDYAVQAEYDNTKHACVTKAD